MFSEDDPIKGPPGSMPVLSIFRIDDRRTGAGSRKGDR